MAQDNHVTIKRTFVFGKLRSIARPYELITSARDTRQCNKHMKVAADIWFQRCQCGIINH